MEILTLDFFITHAWRDHIEWRTLEKLIYNMKSFENKQRNFSLPWHDPALHPGTELGKTTLLKNIETQILPAKIFFLLIDLYKNKSNFFWLDLEIELAKKYGIPIIYLKSDIEENNKKYIEDNFIEGSWKKEKLENIILKIIQK